MNKEEIMINKKKLDIYKKLGAKKFQKFVFKVEDIKWKFLRRAFPNYLKISEKYIDKNKSRKLQKAKTQEEKEKIIMIAKIKKMRARKEYNKNENINYHINTGNPIEFIEYLNWNKSVHQKGIISDLIILPLITSIAILGFTPAIPLAVYNIFSLFINFQCVNLQNYNITRLEIIKDKLALEQEQKSKQEMEKYGDAITLVSKTIKENEDVPTFNEILENIKTKEQLDQLKQLIIREKLSREKEKNNKVILKGNKPNKNA